MAILLLKKFEVAFSRQNIGDTTVIELIKMHGFSEIKVQINKRKYYSSFRLYLKNILI